MSHPTRAVEYRDRIYQVSLAHPAADALPWHLDHDDFAEIVADMRRSGYDPGRPIARTLDGRILNRRRELASRVAGVEPVYRDVDWGDEQIVEYVRREDLLRRSLTPSERAAVTVELADLLPRGRPTADTQTETSGNVAAFRRLAGEPQTHVEIARGAGVSERTVRDAAKVKAKAPEILPAVREGRLPAHTAARVAELPPQARAVVAASPDPRSAAREALSAPAVPGDRAIARGLSHVDALVRHLHLVQSDLSEMMADDEMAPQFRGVAATCGVELTTDGTLRSHGQHGTVRYGVRAYSARQVDDLLGLAGGLRLALSRQAETLRVPAANRSETEPWAAGQVLRDHTLDLEL